MLAMAELIYKEFPDNFPPFVIYINNIDSRLKPDIQGGFRLIVQCKFLHKLAAHIVNPEYGRTGEAVQIDIQQSAEKRIGVNKN